MKNFIIFFNGKEGSSPLVRLLDNFEQVSIMHGENDQGWEPFDNHNCGNLSLRNLGECLSIIYGKSPIDMKRLNALYTRTSRWPLNQVKENSAVGFKMRFTPPHKSAFAKTPIGRLNRWLKEEYRSRFQRLMFGILKKNGVVVFLPVRQNILQWALSHYRGDGTGTKGHLQFKLAAGQVKLSDLGKIQVDCARLEEIVQQCERFHERKKELYVDLQKAGIDVFPICYEDFLQDRTSYFAYFFKALGIDMGKEDIERALNKGSHFRKVHSNDISDFVVNHEEVLQRFGNRFIRWN